MKTVLLILIRFYRYCLSPVLGSNCRYYPTCSCYAQEAVMQFGAIKGGWLSLCRICRCHPWHEGGIDLVPEKKNSK